MSASPIPRSPRRGNARSPARAASHATSASAASLPVEPGVADEQPPDLRVAVRAPAGPGIPGAKRRHVHPGRLRHEDPAAGPVVDVMARAEGGDDPVHGPEPRVRQRDPRRERAPGHRRPGRRGRRRRRRGQCRGVPGGERGPDRSQPAPGDRVRERRRAGRDVRLQALGQGVHAVARDDRRRAACQQVRVQDRHRGHEPLVAERLLVRRPSAGRGSAGRQDPSDAGPAGEDRILRRL